MRVANPSGWHAIVEATEMRRTNADAIHKCQMAAARSEKIVRCAIDIR
nr:DUF6118 family protein [Sphingobium sp. YR768]